MHLEPDQLVIGILQQSWQGGLQSSSMPFKRAIECEIQGEGFRLLSNWTAPTGSSCLNTSTD
jgi:hypothetical protein